MTEAAPAWTKGHDIELLREIARPFAEQFKPHVYGAFGLPKEADIATAISVREAIWTRSGGNRIAGAALFKLLKAGSRQADFAGREARCHQGDVMIRAIAGSDEARGHLVDTLIIRSAAPAIWVEDFVESESAELWGKMGFDRILTKVMASSDLKGLWHLGDAADRMPPAQSPADRASLAMLESDFLGQEDRAAAICEVEDFAKVDGAWAQHYSSYNKRHSWTAFAIRGFDPIDPGFIIKPTEMSRKWRDENPQRMGAQCDWTIAAARFPKIREIVARLPGEPQRVRLMRLASTGGELTRHADIVDPEAGTQDGQTARIHIPLISPPECRFISWGEDGARREAHLAPGGLWYLDTRKPHSVINPGDRDRVHIVVDLFCTDAARALIAGAA